ncbi:hypothetical protein PHJA_002680500 [Phtheirospermum japonicum]|uniref:Uncharacterized protein n=1 Tax=Phtheirospermum japonicum TaxID=374723 RepID=A0A830DB68_9LAMI|nr:hypothetical protein PHJA_002680500 [Phtheirospermum japonicum]
MDIYAKLLQHKYSFGAAIAVLLSLLFFSTVMPNLSSIIFYFWPLILSTALVLVAIIVFGQISPISLELSGYTEGEALLDYVAGRPEFLENNY